MCVCVQKLLSLMADFAYPKFEALVAQTLSKLELTDDQRSSVVILVIIVIITHTHTHTPV